MKTLRSVLLLGIAVLLSGCYTQLQYQQAADQRNPGKQSTSYERERAAETEKTAVKESARKQVRKGDYDRSSKVGFYYVGGERPHYPYYFQDDYFYGHYFGSEWVSYRDYVNWSPSYYRFNTGFHPYFARWQWGSYFRYAHMPYGGPWFSVTFGFGKYYPYYRWYDMYAFHPWGYGYGWNNFYYNNYYFLDDDYAWYDGDRDRNNARYGLRSTGTSRIGTIGGVRGDGSSVRTRGALDSGSSSATRIRSGSSGATRSTGNVGRTRSGGSSRSGSTGSSGNTRKRGGNDQGVQDDGRDKREDVQRTRTVYLGATNFRTLPETSRSTDLLSDENRMQRVRSIYTSGFGWNARTQQQRLKEQRVEPIEMRPTIRDRGGFLQTLGRFFESSRSSYDHIWDRRGDSGSFDRDRDRDRGTVNRGSTGSDTRSRSGSSGSRSRGSGGGGDDGGSSRSRGGGN